jgi:coronin-1B/1C/6
MYVACFGPFVNWTNVSTQTSSSNTALKAENARLTNELRAAREKIRNLELQVESIKANAQKALQSILT